MFSIPRKYIQTDDYLSWMKLNGITDFFSASGKSHQSTLLHQDFTSTTKLPNFSLLSLLYWKYLLFYKMIQWFLYSFGQELSFSDLLFWLIKKRRHTNNSAWKLCHQHLWQLQRSQTMKRTNPATPRIYKACRFSLLVAKEVKFWCLPTFAMGFYCICLHQKFVAVVLNDKIPDRRLKEMQELSWLGHISTQ